MSKPGRQGLSESQIREAISQLQDAGENPSPAKVRNILGSGSYSTIGVALSKWREEQREAVVADIPEMPGSIERLVRQVWLGAWKAANESHSSERTGFEAERSAWELTKSEMADEIRRLEQGPEHCQLELAENGAAMQLRQNELTDREKQLAAANGRVDTLEKEISHLRGERIRSEQTLVELTERAAKAETLVDVETNNRRIRNHVL